MESHQFNPNQLALTKTPQSHARRFAVGSRDPTKVHAGHSGSLESHPRNFRVTGTIVLSWKGAKQNNKFPKKNKKKLHPMV